MVNRDLWDQTPTLERGAMTAKKPEPKTLAIDDDTTVALRTRRRVTSAYHR